MSFLVILNPEATAFVLPQGAQSAVLLSDDHAGNILLNFLSQEGVVSKSL
jgi:hypothetical protein